MVHLSSRVLLGNPTSSVLHSSLVILATPRAIRYLWVIGSSLGITLVAQISTGLFLAMHYASDITLAFTRVSHISEDVIYGWLIRGLHANGASLFFALVYVHIGRGLYFRGYLNKPLWVSGVLILVVLIGTAFLGYVLPWGQMSYWGATVITNLLSAIPYFGETLVCWLWGAFAVGNSTLTRFFTLHFLMPFALLGLRGGHLVLLHHGGSSNPLGLNSRLDKIPFTPYFALKDIIAWLVMLIALLCLTLISPWALGDPENFIQANPLVTPVHIKPEWYFLFAYAVLRAIPNKLGGVVALLIAVAGLLLYTARHPAIKRRAIGFVRKVAFWLLVLVFALLTWVGGKAVEVPYVAISQIAAVVYFGVLIGLAL